MPLSTEKRKIRLFDVESLGGHYWCVVGLSPYDESAFYARLKEAGRYFYLPRIERYKIECSFHEQCNWTGAHIVSVEFLPAEGDWTLEKLYEKFGITDADLVTRQSDFAFMAPSSVSKG